VIIPSYQAEGTIAACLESLRGQSVGDFEVIVVDSSTDGRVGELLGRRFPEARLLLSARRLYCGSARNLALAQARGGIVAFLDADCQAAPDWVERVLAAHGEGHLAVGGGVAVANPQDRLGWVYYFCEFAPWSPAGSPRPMDDAAGANLSYDRSLLQGPGPFLEGTYCSDSEFHWRLARQGMRIHFDPGRVVYHRNPSRLRAILGHQLSHGGFFGRVRARAQAFSPLRRAILAACFPAAAVKLLLTRYLQVRRHEPYRRRFLKLWPLVLLGLGCWTLGEAWGYLSAGPGRGRAAANPQATAP
jgi:glycosyltransferase involved in cell wall biosynthesis